MDQRNKLHDYSLLMIFLSLLSVFNFSHTVVGPLFDGTLSASLDMIPPDLYLPTVIVLGVIIVLTLCIVCAEAFLGTKGMKISYKPNADKGYITVTKVLLGVNTVLFLSLILTLFHHSAPVTDTVISLTKTVVNMIAYSLFIHAASAVRTDFLKNKN